MTNEKNGVHENESNEEIDLDLFEHFRFEVDPGQTPVRIDRYLTDKVASTTRNKVQEAIKSGYVMIDDEPMLKSNFKVQPNQVITVMFPEPPRDNELLAENIPINIVYEDDDLLIVNKEAGMVVHPAYNNWTGTLINALVYHFDNLPIARSNEGRPGLVHRIDKDTSGLLVIAKNDKSLAHLAKQFFDHSIERTYNALVWGEPEAPEGTIDTLLGRSQKDRRITAVYDEDTGYGRQAITHYKLMESYHYVSMIECKLETGRTHQIRAHMQHLGHPLFSDATYGGDKILKGTTFTKYRQFVENAFKLMPRQALHAKTLGFIHPTTGKYMQFDSELPEDFTSVIEKWKNYHSAH